MSFPAADPHKIPIDPNGNLTTKTEGTDSWTYSWNAENQLTKVEKNGAEQARFSYDPSGRRVEKVAGGVTTAYTYDGEATLREVRGATLFEYVHGAAIDEPLARVDGAGTLTYYHADGLGSIAKRTSQTGVVVHEYRYDAWGSIDTGASESGFAFTGREWDPEIGLYYYRARYYDPKIGRFMSEDPVGFRGGLNFHAYAQDNPALNTDPTGLMTCVKWRDGTVTCVPDPSLCLRMGWCTPPPPPCGGFRWYGNFGGPGWTGGGCGTWNTIDHTKAKPPLDPQDVAYCEHDRCYGDCATKPSGWQRLVCRVACDQHLTRDLFNTVTSGGGNAHAVTALGAFASSAGALTSIPGDERSADSPKGICCRTDSSGGAH